MDGKERARDDQAGAPHPNPPADGPGAWWEGDNVVPNWAVYNNQRHWFQIAHTLSDRPDVKGRGAGLKIAGGSKTERRC